MLISNKYKFLFIHIPKTAGTSVTNDFVPYSRLLDRFAYEYRLSTKAYDAVIKLMKWQNDGMKQFTGYHKHTKGYEFEEKMGRELFASYYKFSFVRNPFDLMVSLYFYLLQSENHVVHEVAIEKSFPEFVKWRVSAKPALQTDFLLSKTRDRRLVNYIGRFETLKDDMLNIKKHLNLDKKVRLRHMNESLIRQSRNYQDYYDDETRALVSNYYKTDFEMLGYDYEGFHEDMPIMKVTE